MLFVALVAELADAQRSGRCLSNQVQVRILPRALITKKLPNPLGTMDWGAFWLYR
ncbi:hypothetical protein FD17_GL000176 [Lentilactobacillus sunkii DSM 19904]|uniref:Uncharacterized protein n=1 Tax=Lentilactobacillus sunkii DSM 19904 TaxID=1423808 RepID=A0A0R1LC57_9LACO|nr:hypothetical protein FD17_GL000176 [Lentilactobacillus sunkii DSM 19904]